VSNVLFVVIHLAVLLVFVVPVSRPVVAFAVASYGVRMWAVTAGYHRYFAHRSYKTSRPFQLLLAILGATTMQNGPIWWASVHRRHHKHADTPKDPHSPIGRGIWYAHIGWNFDRTRPASDERSNVSDLTRYPELRFVDRHDWVPLLAYGLACFLIGGLPWSCGGSSSAPWRYFTARCSSTRLGTPGALAGTRRPINHATTLCSRCSPSARDGTTTIISA